MLKVARKSLRYFQKSSYILGQMLPKYFFSDTFFSGWVYPLLTNHAHCMTINVNRKGKTNEITGYKSCL